MQSSETITIPLELGDWSCLEYLGLLWLDLPRSSLLELFAQGRVRSEGKPVGARRQVGTLRDLSLVGGVEGVRRIFLGEMAAAHPGILHEDHRLVALAKPSGLPVVPDRRETSGSVLAFLIRRELEDRKRKPPSEFLRYRIVHRIDRLTSGLVIVAKTAEAERQLGADFEARRVKKEYLAILRGVVRPARLTVHCPVVPGRKGKMRAGPGEKSAAAPGGEPSIADALTELEVMERFRELTLVRARPLTGRTHQIRVHAWAAGHPLAIDPLYGARGAALPQPPAIERLTLHALRYELPGTWEEPRVFECPPAEDFAAAVELLRARG